MPGLDGVYFAAPGVVVVKWDPISKSVCIEWQGWANPTEFAAANEAGLRALREHHTSRWLADLRNLKAIQQSDQNWITMDWFPRMLAAGLARVALVNAKSGLAMMNIRDILGQGSQHHHAGGRVFRNRRRSTGMARGLRDWFFEKPGSRYRFRQGVDLSTSRLDELYADETYLSIHLDRESKCVLSEWRGFANSLEFRAGSMKVLQAVLDTHAVSIVIDNRRSEGVTPLDQLWIRDSFAPLMEAAGLKRMGLVVATHGLAKIATEDIRHQTATSSAIATRVFGTVSDATDWVLGDDQSTTKR